jgi:hypothetical protein
MMIGGSRISIYWRLVVNPAFQVEGDDMFTQADIDRDYIIIKRS